MIFAQTVQLVRRCLLALALGVPLAVSAAPTITGNTISWPDDGWYQVQAVADEGITHVCGGSRFCVVPNGTYIVINHATGERFEDIVVGGDPAVPAVTVTGNTISWPDDGWYQVQAVTDEGITQVCGDTRFCEVPNGTYIVINHTTGERFEPVIVDSDSVDSGDLPVIRADNWQEILRNVVALTNADRAIERRDMILERVKSLSEVAFSAWSFEVPDVPDSTAGTLASLGLTMLPPAADDYPSGYLSCDAGGDLTLELPSYVVSMEANNCAIGGDLYDGDFSYHVDNFSTFSEMTDMTVSLPDSTRYLLSGWLKSSINPGPIQLSTVEWRDASMSEQSGDENYFVEAFNMLREATYGYRYDLDPTSMIFADGTEGIAEYHERSVAVTGSFTVSAPWTDNRAMQVNTDLILGGIYLTTSATPALPSPYDTASGQLVWPESDTSGLPSQQTSGSIDIVAADGSWLSLRPMSDDATYALVDVSGISEPQQVLWSDGFQVR